MSFPVMLYCVSVSTFWHKQPMSASHLDAAPWKRHKLFYTLRFLVHVLQPFLLVACIVSCDAAVRVAGLLALKQPGITAPASWPWHHSPSSARLPTPIWSICGTAPLTRGCSWHTCTSFLGAPARSVEAELRLRGCVS